MDDKFYLEAQRIVNRYVPERESITHHSSNCTFVMCFIGVSNRCMGEEFLTKNRDDESS